MNKKMIFVVLVLVLAVQGLSGCCNRCKNKPEMAYDSVSGTGAAAPSYGAQASAGDYSGNRQAIK